MQQKIYFVILLLQITQQIDIQELKDKYCYQKPYDISQFQKTSFKTINELLNREKNLHLFEKGIRENNFDKYAISLIWISGPFLIIAVFCLISLFILFFCSSCCRKAPKRQPQQTNKTYKQCMFIFTLLIFAFSFIGVILSQQFTQAYNQTQCSIFDSFYIINKGDSKQNWLGLNNISSQLQTIQSSLYQSSNRINHVINDKSLNFDQESKQFDNGIFNYNQKYKVDQNHHFYVQSPSLTNLNKFQLNFIKNIGPINQENTISQQFIQEKNIRIQIIQQAINQLKDNNTIIQSQLYSIDHALEKGQDFMNSYSYKILESSQEIDKQFSINIDNYAKIYQQNIKLVFIFCIMFTVIIFLLLFLIKVCFFRTNIFLLKISWIFSGCFSFIGFLFCSLMFPLVFVNNDMCLVYQKSMNDQKYFNRNIGKNYDKETLEFYSPCIWGDGDIIEKLDIQDYLDEIQQLGIILEQIQQYQDPDSQIQILLNQQSIVAQNTLQIINDILQGAYSDINIDQNNDSHDFFVLKLLNSQTNKTQYLDYKYQDIWSFGQKGCQNGYQRFKGDNGNNMNNGEPICIITDKFNQKMVDQRYSQYEYKMTTLKQYINTLQNYQKQRDTVYNELNIDTQQISQQLQKINDKLKSAINQLINLVNQIHDIVQIISGPKSIFNQVNCLYVKNQLQNLHQSYCQGFLCVNFFILVMISLCSLFFYLKMICDYQYEKETYNIKTFYKYNIVEMNSTRYNEPVQMQNNDLDAQLLNNQQYQNQQDQNLLHNQYKERIQNDNSIIYI